MANLKYSESFTKEQTASKASSKYRTQMYAAKDRGINWNLTFQEWWDWWQETGRWNERGGRDHQYCMCRNGDTGPYSLDNIYCATVAQNRKDQLTNKSHLRGPMHTQTVPLTPHS